MRPATLVKAGALLVTVVVTVLLLASLHSSPATSDTASTTPSPTPTVNPSPLGSAYIMSWPKTAPLTVLYAGESLTQGIYTTSTTAPFAEIVSATLAKSGQVKSTIIGANAQPAGLALTEAKPTAADLTVVEYGTNDALFNRITSFRASYPAYLALVRAASPKTTLVCLGTWTDAARADVFDAVVQSNCTASGGIFVKISDLYVTANLAHKGATWTAGTVPDSVHANDAGQAAIAARVLAAIAAPAAG